MFVPKTETASWEPPAGVEWRDYSDEEFAAMSSAYDAGFSPEQAGSLARFFDHVDEGASAKTGKRRATGDTAGAGR